jgi:murein DD-endopeptidase MepM/ murein hydrolase activator NlpD
MVNSFGENSFDTTLGTMGSSMSRFFGGGQKINDLYAKVFKPIYETANSFAPDPNSFSPVSGGASSFQPSYGARNTFSRFQPNYGPSGDFLRMGSAQVSAPATGTGDTGVTVAAGGEWAKLDQANADIAAAAAKEGVPANLIKSMIYNESRGEWERDGSRPTYIGGQWNDTILPYVGIYRKTAQSWGYDFNAMIGNRALQVEAMAHGLKLLYDQAGSWDGAISMYYSGSPVPTNQNHGDLSDQEYLDQTRNNWHYLDGLGAGTPSTGDGRAGYPNTAGGATQSTSNTGSMATIYGTTPANVTFDFGAEGGPNLYGYGTAYGLNGTQHTGIDISMPLGSNIYAPMAGTVTCGGTGNGPGAGGGGCAAFNDYMGGGNGRIEVQLDNGSVLIFGHTSGTNVQPGQRIAAGALLGRSGGMNGAAHVHLEARVRDNATSSGWRIVDPRTVLGGNAGIGGPGGGTGGTSAPANPNQVNPILRTDFSSPWSSAFGALF